MAPLCDPTRPECLVQSVQPVDCTQKGPETRAAKYGVRTFAVRAATLSVRSQIERFGKPVTASRWQVKGPIVIRCKIGNMHWHVLCLGACKFSRPRPEHESTGCRGRVRVCKCEPALPCPRPAYLRQHGPAGVVLRKNTNLLELRTRFQPRLSILDTVCQNQLDS